LRVLGQNLIKLQDVELTQFVLGILRGYGDQILTLDSWVVTDRSTGYTFAEIDEIWISKLMRGNERYTRHGVLFTAVLVDQHISVITHDHDFVFSKRVEVLNFMLEWSG
jgi:hypothetical protein